MTHSQSVDRRVESERAAVLAAYLLHLGGSAAALSGVLALALPNLIAVALNYTKRADVGTLLSSHHAWMIRTFWWALPWVALGLVTAPVLVGWPILAIVWIWFVYRHVLGLIRLANGESMSQ